MELHLQPEQVDELQLLLEEALADLSYEIAETDSWEYRRHLRERRERVEQIGRQLERQHGRSVPNGHDPSASTLS